MIILITLWLFNIAMENGPFIDDFPIKTTIYSGFSMAMLNNQMVFSGSMLIYIRAMFRLWSIVVCPNRLRHEGFRTWQRNPHWVHQWRWRLEFFSVGLAGTSWYQLASWICPKFSEKSDCRSDVVCCGATFQKVSVQVQLIWIFWAIDQGWPRNPLQVVIS